MSLGYNGELYSRAPGILEMLEKIVKTFEAMEDAT